MDYSLYLHLASHFDVVPLPFQLVSGLGVSRPSQLPVEECARKGGRYLEQCVVWSSCLFYCCDVNEFKACAHLIRKSCTDVGNLVMDVLEES